MLSYSNNMKNILDLQKAFFLSQKSKNLEFRKEQLLRLKNILTSNMPKLEEAIFLDFKKSAFENYLSEFSFIFKEIDDALQNLEDWSKTKSVKTNLASMPAKSYIYPEALGVALVIGAWNYPYNLSLCPAIAAMAAGCTVVLKPSELPVHTSKLMAELINSNFAKEYFYVVEGGINETSELLKQKFDKIFFTGSTQVGKIVYKAAAENLIPVTLELGGKSPAIFDESANFEISIKRLVWAKFLNAGQTCVAPDFVYVPTQKKQEFLQILKKQIQEQAHSIENKNYVQIINSRNFERLIKLIDPNKTIVGGNYNTAERSIEPCVLDNVQWSDPVMQEEIFGPILPILYYEKLEDIIQVLQQKEKPLALYIFSENKTVVEQLLTQISAGGACVNDAIMHLANPHLPFGGVGSSGIGSYHGEAGFKAFSHYKSVLKKNTYFELNLKYHPYTEQKLKWIKSLFSF